MTKSYDIYRWIALIGGEPVEKTVQQYILIALLCLSVSELDSNPYTLDKEI